MENARTLSQSLDSHSSLIERMNALAQLAQNGQIKTAAYFQRRGVTDSDIVADLSSDTWLIMTACITEGKYTDHGKDPMAFVYGIAANVLRHYVNRDRRLLGQVLTLDTEMETNWLQEDDWITDLEETIDSDYRYEEMLARLASSGDRSIAALCWKNLSAPQIAEELQLNIKTVRAGLKRIAEEVRALRNR